MDWTARGRPEFRITILAISIMNWVSPALGMLGALDTGVTRFAGLSLVRAGWVPMGPRTAGVPFIATISSI
jgi:hypothetical protein